MENCMDRNKIFGSEYALEDLLVRLEHATLEEYLVIMKQLDRYLETQFPYIIFKEQGCVNKTIQQEDVMKLRYTEMQKWYNATEENETVMQFVKDEEIQFDKYIGVNIGSAFKLQEKLDVKMDVIERTLKGERTRLVYSNEVLDESEQDIIEYNKIVLYKRCAFILNYIATFMLFEIKDSEMERSMGFRVENGIIIANQFYDQTKCCFKHEKISVYFDGQIHTGTWYVDELYKKYSNQDAVLYITEESIYPLSLCIKLNKMNFKIMNQAEAILSTKVNVIWRGRMVRMTLKDAIPGSGKTTSMKNEIIEKGKEKCLVIVPTREEVIELRNEGFNAYTIDSIHKRMLYYVKENDFNNVIKKIKFIFVDECFMMHSGQLRWILMKIRTINFYDDVFLFGDKGQIPYYSYINMRIKEHRKIYGEVSVVEEMNKTYRCPQIMKQFLENVYTREIEMKSYYTGKINYYVEQYSNFERQIKLYEYKKFKILTFTQAEKQEIRSKYKVNDVITIGESQGQTYDNVILVRFNQYDRVIYTQKAHINVALSRYKNEFVYLTIKSDYLCEIIEAIKNKEVDKMEINTQNMQLGTYVIESQMTPLNKRNVIEELQEINEYRKYWNEEQIYLNEERLEVNEEELQAIVDRMKEQYSRFAEMRERRNLSSVEYMERVFELKACLEESNIKINNNKFHMTLEKERIEMYKMREAKQMKIGQFIAVDAPTARIEKQNLLNTFASIRKRNADPSKIRDFMMTLGADEIKTKFFKTFVDMEKWENSLQMREQFRKDFVEEWKNTRDSQQLNKLAYEHCNLKNIDFNEYHSFIKTITKNQLGSDAYDQEQVAQVVAGAHAVMVEYFTPMVKQFSLLLKNVLKDNVLINDGITVEQMEYFVNSRIYGSKQEIVPMEMDYSKFDKNQDWIDLYYQMIIMKEFGVPEWLCSEWISVHLITQLRFTKFGIVVPTMFQRKSGDAFTFMGNTLFTMIMYSVYYNEIPFKVALFGGDDSLILYSKEENDKIIDCGEEIAAAFNMEIKYLDTTKSVMFASRFFVFTDFHIFILPDLLKQVVRYTRVVETQEHALAQQMSSAILDSNIYKLDYSTLEKYFKAIVFRYKMSEEESNLWIPIMMDYLYLLYHGKTYLMYNRFEELPHADESTMKHLRKHLLKKVNYQQLKQFKFRNYMEKKFLNNINKSTVKIRNERNEVKELGIKVNQHDTIKQIKMLYMSSLLSWFDTHNIARNNIFKNVYVKYNIEHLNEVGIVKQEKNILFKCIDIISKWLPFRNKPKHVICIENNIKENILLDELQSQLEIINDTVKMNTGYEFEVEIVFYDNIVTTEEQ